MRRLKPKLSAAGFYIASVLIAYALAGALANDIYIPGRRTSGLHLHYEAIAPAVLGISLFALTFVLDQFQNTDALRRARWVLVTGSVCAFAWSLYFIISPTGKRLATEQECQATYAKLAAFTGSLSGEDAITEHIAALGAKCKTSPILKTYHDCVARANVPHEVNKCHAESEMLYERKNAS